MQFALLIYEPEDTFRLRSNDGEYREVLGAWRAYYRALVDAGVYAAGAPLEMPSAAATVRLRDGHRQVQDGPYADTKEQLGGQIVLEVATLDEALEWAARCPAAGYGAVEVRPIAEHVRHRVEGP